MILMAQSDLMSNIKVENDQDDDKVLDGPNSEFSLESSIETKK